MPHTVSTRNELLDLLSQLSSEDHSKWENSDLESFLEALQAWLTDCDGFYKNSGSQISPDIASWQIFADALSAARAYE